jgi:hypothetical protein
VARRSRLAALCTSGRSGSAGSSGIVALWVDGTRVLTGIDPSSIATTAVGEKVGTIEHIGVIVFPENAGSDVRFDDFRAGSVSQGVGFAKVKR